jgi:dihydrofolate synthase / folylpolyglutamate synthase
MTDPYTPLSSQLKPSYEGALDILGQALKFGINPSLEGIRAITSEWGFPQHRYVCIQVAGTNGKSSTARLIAALLRAHGFHVGLYTSPELVFYPERMEIDGQVVSDERFAQAIYEAHTIADRVVARRDRARRLDATIQTIDHEGNKLTRDEDEPLLITEFELLTAAALQLFAEEQVDFAVLEVGLGGRWDATSVVDPSVAVITGIGLDHQGILGDTIEEIAAEKAAIIKPACVPILGPGTSETRAVFLTRADACDTFPRLVGVCDNSSSLPVDASRALDTCYTAEPSADPALIQLTVRGGHGIYEHLHMQAPDYQRANIATAIAAVEGALGRALDTASIQCALDALVVPGRFETLCIHPLLIIDAAHNPESAQHLVHALRSRFGVGHLLEEGSNSAEGRANADPMMKTFTLVLGILVDKDARGIIRAFAPLVAEGLIDQVVVSQSDSPRSIPPDDLAVLVRNELKLTSCQLAVISNLDGAIDTLRAEGRNILATGSITVAGCVKRHLLTSAR